MGVFFGLFCLSPGLFCQEISGTIPDVLKRPLRGEAPRYPIDVVIGPLGPGEAPEEAWLFARTVLQAIVNGRDFEGLDLAGFRESLAPVEPESFRAGGGREENDGSVSFLVRFIGREKWAAGELYLRPQTEAEPEESTEEPENPAAEPAEKPGRKVTAWRFDDLLLEDAQDRGTEGDSRRFDFSPYERFF
jgi:hypothetical protein